MYLIFFEAFGKKGRKSLNTQAVKSFYPIVIVVYMKSLYPYFIVFVVCSGFYTSALSQNNFRTNVSTFDVIPLTGSGYYNGSDLKGGFSIGRHYFRNQFDTVWKSWSGFAVSALTDTLTAAWSNQYSVVAGGGLNGTAQYAVCYGGGTIIPQHAARLTGFYVCNTTYAYGSMKNGDAFSKKFGGSSGTDKDWFRLNIFNYTKGTRSDSVSFYLADFRSDNPANDYIIKDWSWVDLSAFTQTDSLMIFMESSDNGPFGMNTPAFFAMDDFNAVTPDQIDMFPGLHFNDTGLNISGKVWNGMSDTSGGFVYGKMYFENRYNTQWNVWSGWAVSKDTDTSQAGLNAQYAPVPAKGAYNALKAKSDSSFAVSYGRSVIRFPYKKGGWPVTYLRFAYTNNQYAYNSMKYGDAFSKKFGGAAGTDPDLFSLQIIGYDDRNQPVDTLGEEDMTEELVLADYRMNRNYLSQNWNYYIGPGFKKNVVRMEFQLFSTDNGPFGMNTPAYFCLDNLFEYPIETTGKKVSANLHIYPNPSSQYIHAEVDHATFAGVFDLNGKLVMHWEHPESNRLNIAPLIPGLYLLRVEKEGIVYSGRFFRSVD